MSLDRIIRKSIRTHPEGWRFDGPRFLYGPGITIVKQLHSDRWTYCVGSQVGYIELSKMTRVAIEFARLGRRIKDDREVTK